MRLNWQNTLAWGLAPTLVVVAGCGGHVSASGVNAAGGASVLSIQAAANEIDTNRTTRLTATLTDGEPAKVKWSLSGGDPTAGAGSISNEGVYTPPTYLTQDAVTVEIRAVMPGQSGAQSGAQSQPKVGKTSLTVVPAFLQPLTPGNLALGAGGTATISSSFSEVGGTGKIRFALTSDKSGTPTSQGTLSTPHCVRGSISNGNPAYTSCSVTYTAPATISSSDSVYVLGAVSGNPALSWTRVLLNADGVSSNPTGHQAHLAVPVPLGSSSGSNTDYDASQGQLTDCCGGTLGALLQDASGNQFVLSNNHVFARSDQAIPGETIVQPGLIDNGCTPYGVGPGTTPVATLTGYPALSLASTNVDAAIARVSPGLIDAKGSILELGAKQQDGTLAAAPPGISSSGGKGETASLGMMVAKSGRTTGLTCAAVSAVSVDIVVDYFTDCAETEHSMSKTFTNQVAIAGANFSDAGDSGALVVDSTNAEPVGLFFAGGTDVNGIEHAIASPIGDVLAELDAQVPATNGTAASYSLVGGADHPVSCLSYDLAKAGKDQAHESNRELNELRVLALSEKERAEGALPQAQLLVNPAAGIVNAAVAASKDHPGEGAVALYIDTQSAATTATVASLPNSVAGVATVVRPAREPNESPTESATTAPQPRAASLALALAVKRRNAASLLKSNPAIFGVGVGQSLDNPSDAAILLFVDRRKSEEKLPESLEGQRVRILLMDRLHVTRAHGQAGLARSSCGSWSAAQESTNSNSKSDNTYLLKESLNLPD